MKRPPEQDFPRIIQDYKFWRRKYEEESERVFQAFLPHVKYLLATGDLVGARELAQTIPDEVARAFAFDAVRQAENFQKGGV